MRCQLHRKPCLLISRFYPLSLSRCEVQQFQWKQFHLPNSIFYLLRKRERSPTDTPKISPSGFSNEVSGNPFPARVNPRPKKIDFFVPSNITFHYTCCRCILKAILIPADERSATFSRHSKLCNNPSYLKNGSSVFHTISILSSPLIITFLITFWIFSLSKDSILMILSNVSQTY